MAGQKYNIKKKKKKSLPISWGSLSLSIWLSVSLSAISSRTNSWVYRTTTKKSDEKRRRRRKRVGRLTWRIGESNGKWSLTDARFSSTWRTWPMPQTAPDSQKVFELMWRKRAETFLRKKKKSRHSNRRERPKREPIISKRSDFQCPIRPVSPTPQLSNSEEITINK